MINMNRYKTLIPKQWGIPEVFRRRLGQDVGRQRLMDEEEHLLVILHMPPTPEQKGMREGALFWIDERNQWKSIPETGGRSALAAHVQKYADLAKDLDAELDRAKTPHQVFEVIEQGAPLLRAARNMMAVLQELRETLEDDLEVLAIRDTAIKAERAADLLMQDAKATLDFLVASSAAKQAEQATQAATEAKKLNRLAAFFFPTVTLASVFGMNEPSTVLAHASVWGVLAIGIVSGAVLWAVLRFAGSGNS